MKSYMKFYCFVIILKVYFCVLSVFSNNLPVLVIMLRGEGLKGIRHIGFFTVLSVIRHMTWQNSFVVPTGLSNSIIAFQLRQ